MKRILVTAEQDSDLSPMATVGGAEAIGREEEEHGSHVFLYVPDLTMETGWSTHRVPEREPERAERRPMGFNRNGR